MPYPIDITHHAMARELHIEWDDGTEQRFDALSLRRACQCAHCKAARARSGSEIDVDDDVDIDTVSLVGGYGVQLVFNDGHDRGIYPWAYLRALNSPQKLPRSAAFPVSVRESA